MEVVFTAQTGVRAVIGSKPDVCSNLEMHIGSIFLERAFYDLPDDLYPTPFVPKLYALKLGVDF